MGRTTRGSDGGVVAHDGGSVPPLHSDGVAWHAPLVGRPHQKHPPARHAASDARSPAQRTTMLCGGHESPDVAAGLLVGASVRSSLPDEEDGDGPDVAGTHVPASQTPRLRGFPGLRKHADPSTS